MSIKEPPPKLIGMRRPSRRPPTGRRSNWEEKREAQLWPPVLLWMRKRKGRLKTLRVRISQFPAITFASKRPVEYTQIIPRQDLGHECEVFKTKYTDIFVTYIYTYIIYLYIHI